MLLCTPCAGFERLGFVDRESTIIVAPESVADAVVWLDKNGDQAQRIADAGRRLIWEKHSLHARAQQFSDCLAQMAQQRYAGSRWQAGEFIIDQVA